MRRLLLDTNALIALSDPNHALFKGIESELRAGAEAFTCVVAWHEYVRGPLLSEDRQRVLRIIDSRIISLERGDAELAASLYHHSGRRRGSTADCLIAAVAIHQKFELVTCNLADFNVFVPDGLILRDDLFT